MKSVKFLLKLKDTERKAGLSHDATEEVSVLVTTDSQFGALVWKLKLAIGCRGRAANPS